MLSDEQKEILSDALVPLYQSLEADVIADVSLRIKETMSYTRTAELEIIALQRLGYSPAQIRAAVMKMLKADEEFQKNVEKNTIEFRKTVRQILKEAEEQAEDAVEDVLLDAADMAWAEDLSLWKAAGKKLEPDTRLRQLADAMKKQTAGELKNLTNSTGFRVRGAVEGVKDLYIKELDKALVKMSSGAFSPEQCVYDVVKTLAKSGIRSVDYASGRTWQLDTAVKMCLRTACSQLAGQIHCENMRQSGETLVQASSHWGARNKGEGIANHEEWQGKVYSTDGKRHPDEEKRIGQTINDLKERTGYDVHTGKGTADGILGVNCRHIFYVFFEGRSIPVKYPPEPKPRVINGKTYDYYAMTQKQRQMEREIRALKREREALTKLEQDTKSVKAQIRQKIKEYEQFSKDCGIKAQMNRLRVESGTSDLTKTEAWKEYKDLVKRQEYDKIETEKYMEMLKNRKQVQENTELRALQLTGDADTITDLIGKTGNVKQRRVYGEDGRAAIDYDTTDHDMPKFHPMGAHKHVYNYNNRQERSVAKELNDLDLARNSDIIQEGVNFHAGKDKKQD